MVFLMKMLGTVHLPAWSVIGEAGLGSWSLLAECVQCCVCDCGRCHSSSARRGTAPSRLLHGRTAPCRLSPNKLIKMKTLCSVFCPLGMMLM